MGTTRHLESTVDGRREAYDEGRPLDANRTGEAQPTTAGERVPASGSRTATPADVDQTVTEPDQPPTRGWGLPLTVIIVGMFMSVLDTSIVNVAIPVIQKQFGVSPENAQWISTSYSLTEGIMVPISAWVGTRIGAKRLYIWSLIAFTVASALCGLSDNLFFMILFRFAQGVPGGMLPVTCLIMLTRMVPKEKFGAAMGLYGLGVVVAPAIGPTLGGYFSEYFTWRLVYYVNLPIGVLGAIAAAMVLTPVPAVRSSRFDVLGFASIAGAFLGLLLVIEEGPSWGWTSYPILILASVSIDLFIVFALVENQVEHPLIRMGVFRNTNFNLSLVLITIFSVGIFAEFFYIPQFLQSARAYTPMQAGMALMPQALVLIVLMPITGMLYDRFGCRWLAVIGLALTATGLFLLSDLNIDMSGPRLTLGMTTMAFGLGLGMMPVFSGGLATLPPDLSDAGGSFNTLVQRVSQALGLGTLSILVTYDSAQFMSDRSAMAYDTSGHTAQITTMAQQGPGGLLPVWQQMGAIVQGAAYANVFYLVGWATLGCIALALFLPTGRPTGGQAVAH